MEIILKGDNAKEIVELVMFIKTPNERLLDSLNKIESITIATDVLNKEMFSQDKGFFDGLFSTALKAYTKFLPEHET
ncbi:MAG: hypothetical protein IJS29_02335 [Selenomonadaceae bacterium]|nr:hypothetical protein [Selenomonadaceae bacterium]